MGAAQSGAIYQFKVALIGITPPIWRRVQVTGDYTLAQLHRVLQVVIGWENYHLYTFRMGSKKYGPPDPDGVDDLGMVDAKRILRPCRGECRWGRYHLHVCVRLRRRLGA